MMRVKEIDLIILSILVSYFIYFAENFFLGYVGDVSQNMTGLWLVSI